MTSWDMFGLLRRRWYLLLLGAVLTVAGTYATTHRPGVYWTGYEVVVLAPTESYYANPLENAHHDMARFAGIVVREWNGARPGLLTASSDTRLYGEGQRSAVQVRMANEGSQWKPLYPVPVIDIEVVDPSPSVARARAAQTLGEVEALLRGYQDEAGVAPEWRITALATPAVSEVTYHAGSRARAAGATGVLGVSLTLVGIWWVDRRLLLRRGRATSTRGERMQVADDRELVQW